MVFVVYVGGTRCIFKPLRCILHRVCTSAPLQEISREIIRIVYINDSIVRKSFIATYVREYLFFDGRAVMGRVFTVSV